MSGALSDHGRWKSAPGRRDREGAEPTTLERAAWHYSQEYGWRVFPCRPRGKEPWLSKADSGNGCLDASTHPEAIGNWWARCPNANIGVATGGQLGLIVLDVDGAAGEQALLTFGAFPPTPEALTARGRHLYFRAPSHLAICTTQRLGAKLDTRGAGGYVLAPPSQHPDGPQYVWREGCSPNELPVAHLPEALADALVVGRQVTGGVVRQVMPSRTSASTYREVRAMRAWMARIPTGLRDGDGRNAIAYRIAARALETLSTSESAALLATWNHLNAEPLPAGELFRILANAARYTRGRAA